MSRALVLGFYASPNLGDVALSVAIDGLVAGQGFEVVRHDFCTAEAVGEVNTATQIQTTVQAGTPAAPWSRLSSFVGRRLALPALGAIRAAQLRLAYLRWLHAGRWARLSEELGRADTLILAGGNMMMDLVPTWPPLFRHYCTMAHRAAKPCHVVYVGVGPIRLRGARRLFRQALSSVASISVRDANSSRICQELIAPRKAIETVDPVFSFPWAKLERRLERVSTQGRADDLHLGVCGLGSVCFETKTEQQVYRAGLEAVMEQVWRGTSGRVRLTLFSSAAADYEAVRALGLDLSRRWKDRVTVAFPTSVDALVDLYEGLDLLLGGRMHSLIIAHKCLLPHVGIVWQDKVRGYAEATKQLDRIFTVQGLAQTPEQVTYRLLASRSDPELIRRMDHLNQGLRRSVNEASRVLRG